MNIQNNTRFSDLLSKSGYRYIREPLSSLRFSNGRLQAANGKSGKVGRKSICEEHSL